MTFVAATPPRFLVALPFRERHDTSPHEDELSRRRSVGLFVIRQFT